MSDFSILLKLELTRLYGWNKAKYSKSKDEKNKFKRSIGGLIAVGVLMLGMSIMYGFIFLLINGEAGVPEYSPAMMLTVSSIFGLFTTIHNANGVLFGFKDYDTLSAMPVKNSAVIFAKLVYLYIENFLFYVVMLLPVSIMYGVQYHCGFLYYPVMLSGIILSPVIPISVGLIIGTILSVLASKFKKSNVANIILAIVLMGGWLYFCFSSGENGDEMYVNLAKAMNTYYPVANVYTNGIVLCKLMPFIIYVAVSLAIALVLVFAVAKFFKEINTLIMTKRSSSGYKMKALKTASIKKSLVKKEFKRLVSSANYFMNSCIGTIMMFIIIIILFIKAKGNVNGLFAGLETEEIEDMQIVLSYVRVAIPILLMVFTGMSSTTMASVSLEGKQVWIIKSLPIDTKDVLNAKLILNVIITGVSTFICMVILGIFFQMSWYEILIGVVLCLTYAVFYAEYGLMLNLKHIQYDWENEVQVIKQGTPVAVSTLTGLFSFIPLGGVTVLGILLSAVTGITATVITWLLLIILVGLGAWLLNKWIMTKGVKRFEQS